MEGVLIRGWDLILPGCGGTSTLARGATLAVRWLHELPSTISQSGLGFPHRAGRYRPGESLFLSPAWLRCRYMEVFLIRGWDLILPECGGTSMLPP